MALRIEAPRLASLAPLPLIDRRALLIATTLAVAGELTLQRVLVRVAVHIPNVPVLRGPYALMAAAGSVVFTGAALLVLLALATTAWCVARRLPPVARSLFIASVVPLPMAGVASGIAGVTSGMDVTLALLDLLALAVVGALLATASRGWARVMTVLVVTSLTIAAVLAALGDGGLTGTLRLDTVGEMSLLLGALIAPFALLRDSSIGRRELVVAAGTAIVVLLLQTANPATTGILMLWALGLTGSLFAPLYWGAAGAIALTVAGLARQGRITIALAVALIAMGGYGLHNTYQSTVQILGLCLLAEAWGAARLPSALPAAAQGRESVP